MNDIFLGETSPLRPSMVELVHWFLVVIIVYLTVVRGRRSCVPLGSDRRYCRDGPDLRLVLSRRLCAFDSSQMFCRPTLEVFINQSFQFLTESRSDFF